MVLGLPDVRELAEPHRLAIALAIATSPAARLGFVELARQLGLTEGNLACHVRRLHRDGLLVVQSNGARGRASRTEYVLTPSGRSWLATVRQEFESLARVIAEGLAPTGRVVRSEAGSPWPGQMPESAVAAAALSTSPTASNPPEVTSIVDERFSGPD